MKKSALLAILGLAVVANASVTWNQVPMAGGDNPDSYRSWLLTDPATGNLYYSKWNGQYNIYGITPGAAVNYGTTTAADWTTLAAPAPYSGTNDDWGGGFNIHNGYFYGSTFLQGVGATARQFVRANLSTGEFSTLPPSPNPDTPNFSGVAYEGPAGLRITAKWTGWNIYRDFNVTTQSGANFSYGEHVNHAGTAPGYWGSNGAVGNDGYFYFMEPGQNNTAYQFRRGSLSSANMAAELGTPWVSIADFPLNTDHNRRTSTALEFVPGGITGSGPDELWVMPMNLNGVQTDKIYRFLASDGSLLGDVDLPFVQAHALGHGYDLAYSNGYVFVMEGRGGDTLWSAAVPEPASLLLLSLAGLFLRRR